MSKIKTDVEKNLCESVSKQSYATYYDSQGSKEVTIELELEPDQAQHQGYTYRGPWIVRCAREHPKCHRLFFTVFMVFVYGYVIWMLCENPIKWAAHALFTNGTTSNTTDSFNGTYSDPETEGMDVIVNDR